MAGPFVGLDEKNMEGCFFCFPDLSCRTPGSFRLKFALKTSTPLTKHLREQGFLISIKKGDKKTGTAHGREESADDDIKMRIRRGHVKSRDDHDDVSDLVVILRIPTLFDWNYEILQD